MSTILVDNISGRTDPNTVTFPPVIKVGSITARDGEQVSLPANTLVGIILASTVAITALTGLPAGQLAFDTTVSRLKLWNGSAWVEVGGNAANNDAAYTGRHIPGEIVAFAGTLVPSGYLRAEGQLVSRTDYPALFGAITTTHGSGDGATTFQLPDYRGRVIVGDDNGAGRITVVPSGVGKTGGAESVALSIPQIPAHTHGVPNVIDTSTNGGAFPIGVFQVSLSGPAHPVTSTSAGSGQAHPNLQPFCTAMVLIKF